jgi:GNAT superfamily N-acetyltransferase
MREVSIRHGTLDDVEAFAASSARLFAEDAGTHDPLRSQDWPRTHGAQWAEKCLGDPSMVVLLAWDGADVVGHLLGVAGQPSPMWTAGRAELVSMYVAPAWRGRKVGSRMVDEFVTWARDRGAARLLVTAYAANDGAIRFYRRHGFTPLSVTLAADR